MVHLHKEIKLFLPRRDEILLIDDGGSASEDLLCFSSILINKEIELMLKDELTKNGVMTLHARSIRGKARSDYTKAFDIFYKTLRKTKNRSVLTVLADKKLFEDIGEKYRKDFEQFCGVSGFGSLDSMLKVIFQQGVFPIMEALRKTSENLNYPRINLTIKLANSGNIWKFCNRITFPNKETLLDFINASLQKIYGDRFIISDLKIDSAHKEPVMSIVDAMANFTFNHIKTIIKEDPKEISPTERMKSEVFKEFLSKTELTNDAKEFDKNLKGEFFYKGGSILSRNRSVVCLDLR